MTKYKLTDEDSAGRVISYTVCSDFGTDSYAEVCVKLQDESCGNTFYNKHVLRRGEDPKEILELRNSMRNASFDVDGIQKAQGMNIGLSARGASASTVICLEKTDFNIMIFNFAQCLYEEYVKGTFAAQNQNYEVQIMFKAAQCVYSLGRGKGRGGWYQSMIVGAQLNAEDTAEYEYSFSVNHCVSEGDE
jgi:hypothetical protein